jgi:hypothetical protein
VVLQDLAARVAADSLADSVDRDAAAAVGRHRFQR